MNKIPITIAAISQYTIPETILFEIPLLNCPKESAPVTNSRNRFMIPLPIVPKKVIQSKKNRRKDSCEQCSCYAVPCQQEHKAFITCCHLFIFFLQLNFSIIAFFFCFLISSAVTVIAFLIRHFFLDRHLYRLLVCLCIAFCLLRFFVLKFPCHDFCVGSFPAVCLAG